MSCHGMAWHGMACHVMSCHVMVRSTLLPLGLGGPLRAFSGGPPAVLFFAPLTGFLKHQKGIQKRKLDCTKGFKLWGIRWCPWFFQGTTATAGTRLLLGLFLVDFHENLWKIHQKAHKSKNNQIICIRDIYGSPHEPPCCISWHDEKCDFFDFSWKSNNFDVRWSQLLK